jgi:poly(3-hydroxybutyrate) depolymerase
MWKSVIALLMATAAARGAELPTGQIVDSVECALDAAQHYALYLPSNYTPSRQWSVILAFDGGAHGRVPVERYQQAAEKYGYIVAGSLNSRNGPWEVSMNAAKAMTADVKARFSIDPKRVYTAGLSGGARVAMKIALESRQIAGVFASSAGFPDEFIARVPFPVFGSAGTDDFNHLEMYQLDRRLTSAQGPILRRRAHVAARGNGHAGGGVDGIAGHEIRLTAAGLGSAGLVVRGARGADRRAPG